MGTQKTTRRRLVWFVQWDSGGPFGGGEEEVYQKGDKYYFRDSSSGDGFKCGNLRTLLRRHNLNRVDEATVSICSPVLSDEEGLAMLDVRIGVGRGVRINGKVRICKSPGVLMRPKDDPA